MVRNTFFRFCIVFFVLFLSFSFALATGQIDKTKQVEKIAPNFSLPDLEAKTVGLASFKGKSIILFFWTTWCPYCRRSLIDLEAKYPAIKSKGIVVLGIDIGEPSQKIKNFLQKYPASFPVLLDVSGEIAEEYNVIGIPTYVLIGADGNIKSIDNVLPTNYSGIFK